MESARPESLMPRVNWPLIEKHLTRALRGSGTPLAAVKARLFGSEDVDLLLIENDDGELVGHCITLAIGRELMVVSVGGVSGKDWVPLLHSWLLEQVRAGRFDKLTASCRPGMMRWLRQLGWTVRRYEMECA